VLVTTILSGLGSNAEGDDVHLGLAVCRPQASLQSTMMPIK